MAQAPLGLWHLHGSMQILSDQLVTALERDGGVLMVQKRVTGLVRTPSGWIVEATGVNGATCRLDAGDVICSLPPQCLLELMPRGLPRDIAPVGTSARAQWRDCSLRRDFRKFYPKAAQDICNAAGETTARYSSRSAGMETAAHRWASHADRQRLPPTADWSLARDLSRAQER